MSEMDNLYCLFNDLGELVNSTNPRSEDFIVVSQKIQNALTLLQSNLTDNTQKDLLEADLATWKQQLQDTGYGELLEGPLVEQMEQLLTALRDQNLAAIGQTFEVLAAYYDESGQPIDTSEILASLEKHLPKPYFEELEPQLKNANPNLLHQTLREVAHHLKTQPENIDLDAIVQVFEQNLGHLFGKTQVQKEAERMENYRSSARQSILKSLKANGIQHPED
jgi:hypothetical protein